MDDINDTNEICKNYLLTYISSPILKTTTTIDDELFTITQNYEWNDNLEPSDPKKLMVLTEQIKKSNIYTLDRNTNILLNEGMLIGITIQIISINQ